MCNMKTTIRSKPINFLVEEELSIRRRIIQYAEENYDFSEGIYPEQFLGSAETYQ